MTESPPDTGRRLTESEAYRRMYRVTSRYDRPFEEKVDDLLAVGCRFLGLPAGFLTETTEDTQHIVRAHGDHPLLQQGEACPLDKSYCRKTIAMDETHTVQHARIEGWEGDAAYEKFGLESYIGASVVVDGELYGSFCFADTEPRDDPFTTGEETFVELMAEWVSYELFTKQATERLREQRDQLEKFTSVVSHDLRNPLSVARGYLDMAERTGDPEHFQRVRSSLERMDALIDDLLVLTRESESASETDTIRIDSLATGCWEYVPTGEATLTVETDATIVGDESRVQQLFANLFRNAIEHGGGNVTVRVGTLPEESGVFIEDDGTGIPPETRDRIFDDGFSTSDEGTGLGLTIVQQVATAHDWEISVTDGEAGGTRFEITGVEFVDE